MDRLASVLEYLIFRDAFARWVTIWITVDDVFGVVRARNAVSGFRVAIEPVTAAIVIVIGHKQKDMNPLLALSCGARRSACSDPAPMCLKFT